MTYRELISNLLKIEDLNKTAKIRIRYRHENDDLRCVKMVEVADVMCYMGAIGVENSDIVAAKYLDD